MVYLIGSLRNPKVPKIAGILRDQGFEVFDDWFAAGPEADDKWRDYEKSRGRTYVEALQGLAADHVFRFDRTHLKRADAVVLIAPAGKSGHMELGWALGQGTPGFILLDDPDRWDVMYKFATGVFTDLDGLVEGLCQNRKSYMRMGVGVLSAWYQFINNKMKLQLTPPSNPPTPRI